jgi:hypothetical protein
MGQGAKEQELHWLDREIMMEEESVNVIIQDLGRLVLMVEVKEVRVVVMQGQHMGVVVHRRSVNIRP